MSRARHRFIFTALMICLSLLAKAQPKPKMLVQLKVSGESAWWAWAKGQDINSGQELGWDRTYNAPAFRIQLLSALNLRSFELGLAASRTALFVEYMRAASNSPSTPNVYRISNGSIGIYKLGAQLAYSIGLSKSISLKPFFQAGFFTIESLHPEADRFDKMSYFEPGVEMGWTRKKLNLLFGISSGFSRISVSEGRPGEGHKILGLGYSLGINYRPWGI